MTTEVITHLHAFTMITKMTYPSYAAFAFLEEPLLSSTEEIWSSCYCQNNSLSHFVFTHTDFYCSFKVSSQQGLT